jgi:predicted AlkP superfamily phosphohydrolase/phosphomutase
VLAACGSDVRDPGGRVLVVGLDGATNRVIDELFAAGELPHLRQLAASGVRGAVRPEGEILSPRIWTTFATGLPAEAHGVEGWVKHGPAGGLRLYSNLDRTAPALWNIVGAAGRRVAVLNWLMTQPPDRVAGVMISDHAVPGILQSRLPLAKQIAERDFGPSEGVVAAPEIAVAYAWPPEWVARSHEIREAGEPPLTAVPNPFEDVGTLGSFMHRVFRDDELTLRTALVVEQEIGPDLLMVYLPGIDRVSHFLWQGIEVPIDPEPGRSVQTPAQREKAREQLLAYYRFTDALLGHLLARYDANDFVFVVSDHGFEASRAALAMPGSHASERARNGVLYARGPGIEAGTTAPPLADIDVLPSLLAALGLPQAEDLPGQVAPFLETTDLASVASYADLPVERVETVASDVDAEILESLRTLGYVE